MPRNMPSCKNCGHPEYRHAGYSEACGVGIWNKCACGGYTPNFPPKPAPPAAPPERSALTVRLLIPVLALFLLPANFLAAEEEKANPNFYYEYTQDNGTKAFADKLENVPPKYKGSAKQQSWVVLTSKTDKKTTISQYRGQTRLLGMRIQPEAKKPERECTKPLTMDYIYKQVGDITRVYYRMFDGCGRVVAELPFHPPYSYMEPKYVQQSPSE